MVDRRLTMGQAVSAVLAAVQITSEDQLTTGANRQLARRCTQIIPAQQQLLRGENQVAPLAMALMLLERTILRGAVQEAASAVYDDGAAKLQFRKRLFK
jgi:hypothetical protein